MKYVALLRGINVGGNNKVEMVKLKAAFESFGAINVKTYINSGNVIFESEKKISELTTIIETTIEKDFGFHVHVVLRDEKHIKAINNAIPKSWQNNQDMKTDVMFLWKEIDSPDVLKQLKIKPDIDEVKYVPGAILWRVDRDKVTRSGLLKIIGTDLYKKMTIRNVNTVRKIHTMIKGV